MHHVIPIQVFILLVELNCIVLIALVSVALDAWQHMILMLLLGMGWIKICS